MPALPAYSVSAYNLSHASENKIHDDSVAQSLGFTGVSCRCRGVCLRLPPARGALGSAFLTRGEMLCRFFKPVYDGRLATVTVAGV